VRLLTNNPAKLDGLSQAGIDVSVRVPLQGPINSDNRRYLTAITAIVLNVPEIEAKARVDDAVTRSAEALHRARVAVVLQAFFVAAALLVGAVIAWHAATEGGKDREAGAYHFWEWRRRRA